MAEYYICEEYDLNKVKVVETRECYVIEYY